MARSLAEAESLRAVPPFSVPNTAPHRNSHMRIVIMREPLSFRMASVNQLKRLYAMATNQRAASVA